MQCSNTVRIRLYELEIFLYIEQGIESVYKNLIRLLVISKSLFCLE